MFYGKNRLIGVLALAVALCMRNISSAAIFSSINFDNGIGVQGANGNQTDGVTSSTLPVSKTISVNVGPTAKATYTFIDSGNFASLEIKTSESLAGAGQFAFEESDGDTFAFAQPVSYHFLFQDTVTAGFMSENGTSLYSFFDRGSAFGSSQIQNSSYEHDGILIPGNTYYLDEYFELNNQVMNGPTTASGTSYFLLTFTAIPEPSSLCLLGVVTGTIVRGRRLRKD